MIDKIERIARFIARCFTWPLSHWRPLEKTDIRPEQHAYLRRHYPGLLEELGIEDD